MALDSLTIATRGLLSQDSYLIAVDGFGDLAAEETADDEVRIVRGGRYISRPPREDEKDRPPVMEGFDLREFDIATGRRIPRPEPVAALASTPVPLVSAVQDAIVFPAPVADKEDVVLDKKSDRNLRILLLLS